jgi:hypothetical protein
MLDLHALSEFPSSWSSGSCFSFHIAPHKCLMLSVFTFGRRSETITTFPVGHAALAFVHCAGGVSRKFHNILVPGDASSIPLIDETPAICAAPWRQCSFQRFCSWFAYLPVDSAHGLAFPAFCMELVFKSPTSWLLVLIATDQPTSIYIYRHRILQSTNESYQECPYGKAKASSRSCQLPSCC